MAASRLPKTPASAVSATTVVVLVAMAAVGAGTAPVPAERGGQRDAVTSMAAAVAAVARDLMVEPSSAALPALLPAVEALAVTAERPAAWTDGPVLSARPSLGERLLDLPPPAAGS